MSINTIKVPAWQQTTAKSNVNLLLAAFAAEAHNSNLLHDAASSNMQRAATVASAAVDSRRARTYLLQADLDRGDEADVFGLALGVAPNAHRGLQQGGRGWRCPACQSANVKFLGQVALFWLRASQNQKYSLVCPHPDTVDIPSLEPSSV